ncbi:MULTISPECIES: 4-hydroxy-tetrahydrodipicolinate synthase [unclassified Sporosarcina]|uniref:4-hydroxy-tetrahydrodipicolinate synthase n=1 Tax=unclassified Sporosarcina TaxID=2647733 RepID=UPI00203F120D|nr:MULTISPECIES: 4-hydroxy-tetrahydrodipicolinate synthase [unclassified Sporosarcina]GKV64139.1 4-hydroxy-tetrahydrodipicolinate synthase [Sporosarcina sp. NCCP-2331]GLB54396.1 4-hydroxy-tetrahydrodipicolinate synthase [Sporosarcina sp. NCCP-2378]
MELGNIGTAMVTPFSPEGTIDFKKTADLLEHLIANGTDSVIVSGTTGESPTVTEAEKKELLDFVVKTVNKRIPVIAGTGTNGTAESIDLTRAAESAGADGIMLVTPYYNRPDQQGMYAHFAAIANETKLPVLLYNIPSRSVVNLLPETIIELSKIDNIKAVKEASGSLEQMAAIIENTADDFQVYSGDDSLTLPLLAVGGRGIISVSAHVVGNEMQQMIQAFQKGRMKEAAKIHRALLPVFSALFSAPNPVPVKYALKKAGISVGGVRLPLVELEPEQTALIDLALENFKKNQLIL